MPHILSTETFHIFNNTGKGIANWHLHYETVEPYPLHESMPLLETDDTYRVQKMAFAKQGKDVDKSVIRYNSQLTLSGIPPETYEYIVNGKPALEWIMERYQITTDKDSGIRNDPNDWSDNPRYILDLLKRIVRVSVETVRIVKGLPALNEFKV
jgi:predicted helicase